MPSPSKRTRLEMADIPPTPPLSAPRSSSTSVSIDSLALALPEPSRQSALRFFATLATLPGKYQLDEEDDDLVDFETDSIIPGKKGFLTSSNAEWKFGCFALPQSIDADGELTLGDNETDLLAADEEEDELDLIRPKSPSKSPEKVNRAASVHLPEPSALHLPPLDPANNTQDAEDLQEFLQANAMQNKRLHDATSEDARRDEEGEDDYRETFEDSGIPNADEDSESQSVTNQSEEEEDEDSDDMGGYNAGEGSVVRNTDGSIRSIPTPGGQSPSRARSRSMSVKPIQYQSPIKQPIFTPSSSTSARNSTPSITRHTSRRPSPPRYDSFTSLDISGASPLSSPVKATRIRSRRSSRTDLPTPQTLDGSDLFLRPPTPPFPSRKNRGSRSPSPEVLPAPPTPPPMHSRTTGAVYSSPTSSGTNKAGVGPTGANSISPTIKSRKSREDIVESDGRLRSSGIGITRSQKGKGVDYSQGDLSPSRECSLRNGFGSSSKKLARLDSEDEDASRSHSHSAAIIRGRKRKRSLSMGLPESKPGSERSMLRGIEVEDTFQYPFRSRSHSPVNDLSVQELETHRQPLLPRPRKMSQSSDVGLGYPSTRCVLRARSEAVPQRRRQPVRSDEIEISERRVARTHPPPPSSSNEEYDEFVPNTPSRSRHSRTPAYYSQQQTHQQSDNSPQNPNDNPHAVFSQAMRAMQAMSAMMMQYADVVGNVPSPARAPSQWMQQRNEVPLFRTPLDWSEGQESGFPISSSTSSSPIRRPPPSSSPSPYEYEHPDSEVDSPHPHHPPPSRGASARRGRTESFLNPLPSGSTPRLPSALVHRSSSPTSIRSQPHSRIRKRVSFELKSVQQVINISSDEGEVVNNCNNDKGTEEKTTSMNRRRTRGSTPAPTERPITRQSSRTRLGTPSPPLTRSNSSTELMHRRSSLRLRQ